MLVKIYTDGACSGNPGPGGWGAILMYKESTKELSGFEPETTNNRMELTAAIRALDALKEPCVVTLYTDSAYLCRAFMALQLDAQWLADLFEKAGGKSSVMGSAAAPHENAQDYLGKSKRSQRQSIQQSLRSVGNR